MAAVITALCSNTLHKVCFMCLEADVIKKASFTWIAFTQISAFVSQQSHIVVSEESVALVFLITSSE